MNKTKKKIPKSYLKDMDRAKRESYVKRMKTYTSEDYDKATEDVLDQMGEPTEEQLDDLRNFFKNKRETDK